MSSSDEALKIPAAKRNVRAERLREFWHYFSENNGAVAGLGIIVLLVLLAVFADVVAPHSPIHQYRGHFLVPPVWMEGGSWDFILGTDAVGRDMLSRLIHGARYSLYVGTVVITIAFSAGITLGLIAGFFRGTVETLIARTMDIILAFPAILLALVLVTILGPSLTNAMIAVAVVVLPHFVRLTRASVVSESTRDYVTSARVAGARLPRLMFVTVLPNCMAPLIVQATLSFSNAILGRGRRRVPGPGAPTPPRRSGAPCCRTPASSSPAPGGW
ncbi:ABC transporter permease subunit [Pelagibius marinus]|uniref:ABC transporter permease subunit n=1 Tax=Pelagibius marinus TaxID=2762760 RepID=UPI002AC349E3|nr:ABC transporter permease subunit [Pelagibius marinus]